MQHQQNSACTARIREENISRHTLEQAPALPAEWAPHNMDKKRRCLTSKDVWEIKKMLHELVPEGIGTITLGLTTREQTSKDDPTKTDVIPVSRIGTSILTRNAQDKCILFTRYVNQVLHGVLRYNLKEEEEWTTLKLFRGRHHEPPDDAVGVIYLIHLGILVTGGS